MIMSEMKTVTIAAFDCSDVKMKLSGIRLNVDVRKYCNLLTMFFSFVCMWLIFNMIFVHLLSQNIRPDLSQSAFLAIARCVSAHTAIQVSSYIIYCIQFCTCCLAGYPEFSKIVVLCLLCGGWLHLTFLGYVIMSVVL